MKLLDETVAEMRLFAKLLGDDLLDIGITGSVLTGKRRPRDIDIVLLVRDGSAARVSQSIRNVPLNRSIAHVGYGGYEKKPTLPGENQPYHFTVLSSRAEMTAFKQANNATIWQTENFRLP